jgi:hypothetical protein
MHLLPLGIPRDLFPLQATCMHFSSPHFVSRECVVKKNVREETKYITIQRMRLIILMTVKGSDVNGKEIIERTKAFLVPA